MPRTKLEIPAEMISRYRELQPKVGDAPSTYIIGMFDPELYEWIIKHCGDVHTFRDQLPLRVA